MDDELLNIIGITDHDSGDVCFPGLTLWETAYFKRIHKMTINEISTEQFDDYKFMNIMIMKAMCNKVKK